MSGELGSSTGLRSRAAEFGRSLTGPDKISLIGMLATIVVLHVVGFGVLLGFVAPHRYRLGGDHGVLSVGVGVLAYTFGLRHAFDADHIAAVDNATRKLVADRRADRRSGRHAPRQPLSVGFWFSLGHSSVVFGMAFLLATGVRALGHSLSDDRSGLQSSAGMFGASVSGLFLWVMGLVNLAVLVGIVRIFRDMRRGDFDDSLLEEQLARRGFMARLLSGLTKLVRKPWHIYPIGVLFGLGFDTTSEVALLVLAGGAAASALPAVAILVLPILFAAAMCLMDTLDGVFMNAAYGWAEAKPVRKVYYNITITTISVSVALLIGSVELLGVAANQAHIESGPVRWVADLNLDYAGYAIVALFVCTWLVAGAIWRWGRVEERWSGPVG